MRKINRRRPAKTRTYDKQEAEAAIARYCSYQERTLGEVKKKLGLMNIGGPAADELIRRMLDEGFINEQRYADAYVRGKLNQDKWGRLKVSYSLSKKGISQDLIDLSFDQYGEDKYRELAVKLIRKKYNATRDKDRFLKKQKTARFMISKGFESRLVWDILNEEAV